MAFFTKIPDTGSKIYMIVAVFLIISLSCGRQESALQTRQMLNVEGYKIVPEAFTTSISATGELLPHEDVEIKTPVSGNVMRIYFEEGEKVREDDMLVAIDSRAWQARKRGLEARLITAKSELERRRDLFNIDGASQEDIEQSEAEVSSLEAQIEELQVMIELALVRAPFSGRLGMRNFSPGAYLSQGETLTRLVKTDFLKLDFNIPARYAALAAKGDDVTLVSSSSGDTAVARIYAIDPAINPSSRSLQIRAELDNSGENFFPGDFVQITFEVEQLSDALLVPAESLVMELNRQVVYVAKDGIAKRCEVEIGRRTRERVQIVRGLSEGDVVLTTGLMEISDGDQINLTIKNQEVAE